MFSSNGERRGAGVRAWLHHKGAPGSLKSGAEMLPILTGATRTAMHTLVQHSASQMLKQLHYMQIIAPNQLVF